ncbi:MAG TPA: amidohydrolase family protein [Gemmatimonadales bacterium]|nr:amidohydrolase family protein [Gemmatimonadales bacterium]
MHEGTVLSFDLSPDGRTIVFDLLGQLWQMPAPGGDARPLTDAVRDTAEDRDPSFSPDGGRIVFRGERDGRTGLWLLEPGGAPRQLTQLSNPDGYDGNAAWSPDGKGIAFVRLMLPDSASPRPRMRAMWLDPATRETRELRVPDTVGPRLRDPAWAPDGRRLAIVAAMPGSADGGRLWLVEPDGGRATALTSDSSQALAPAFAPDGRRLAFFAPDSAERIQVWVLRLDTAGAAPMRVSNHADVTPTRVRWTSDGRRLVYSADGRFWSVSATGGGGPPTEITFSASLSFERPRRVVPPAHFPEPGKAQHARAFMGLALSPDGRRVGMLALGKLWVMPVGGSARAVADVPLSARSLTWSPDGSVVWWAGRWGEENLFATDVATGKTRQLTALPGRESNPVFAPNGQLLAFLHQPNEDTTLIRVIDPRGATMTDARQGRTIPTESGADVSWIPSSDGLLIMTGGWSPGSPTKGTIVRFAGEPGNIARMPDSPLSFQWVGKSIFYVRHARLWRARFDSTGMIGDAEPLGTDPAMYASVAQDGTVLYISEGGLRLRSPNGREQRLGWPLSYTPPVPAPLLIRNVRVIDGTGRPVGTPQDLLVQRGRIASMVATGTRTTPATDTLDAGGRFILPGMMDLHAHEYRPALLAGFAYFGVTTIRDQGSPIAPLIGYADAIAAGKLDGPRVDFGGFQFYTDWAYDAEDQQGVEPEADSNHAARSVEMAKIFGSQHIKTRTFRRWDINARLIAEAHRRGMRATGHCSHLLPLVAAGMDAKEHAGFCDRTDGEIYDDFVQLYRAAGIGVVPTIAYSSFAVRLNEHPDMLAGDSELAPFLPERNTFNWMLGLNPARRRMFANFARWARSATPKLVRGGVVIGTGTDIWQIPTGVHMELEELVGAGLSPLEAIRAATGDAARIVGVEQDLGTIAVGKLADLVILDADPLADIRNSRRIWAVLQSGRVLNRSALVARIGSQE